MQRLKLSAVRRPMEMQEQLIEKKIKFWIVDAYRVAREAKMGVRINTVMQTCFFKLAGILEDVEAFGDDLELKDDVTVLAVEAE